jgi:hypothetical protein
MGVGGHEYVIYDNGEIDGFGPGAIVFNNYPQLLASQIQALRNGMSAASACPATIVRDERSGAEHSTPP